MKNFAVTGVAGYIAPRHLQAIKDTGNRIIAAVDPHDSVGILDSYSTETSFFTEFERFDRHLEKLRRGPEENRVHYVSICSPNYLHDAHCRQALRVGADVICEKPLVINPWNLDALSEIEEDTGGRINAILQLRVHPALLELREKLRKQESQNRKHDVVLTYITSRGKWYHYSWKGDLAKSGGIATNIGIHFFDLLIWLFGDVQEYRVFKSDKDSMSGWIELERANVRWFLSLNPNHLPYEVEVGSQVTYRSITIDGDEIEFTRGFRDLHTRVYEEVLKGNGFGIEDVRPSIELVHNIRYAPIVPHNGMHHEYLTTEQS